MDKDKSGFFEYTKHYSAISFNVNYSYYADDTKELFFTAQPIDPLNNLKLTQEFIYGKIDMEFNLQIGLRDFQIVMTPKLHDRMGLLYEEIRSEYVEFRNKNF